MTLIDSLQLGRLFELRIPRITRILKLGTFILTSLVFYPSTANRQLSFPLPLPHFCPQITQITLIDPAPRPLFSPLITLIDSLQLGRLFELRIPRITRI